MNILPSLEVTNLGASLKILSIDNSLLTQNRKFTFLSGDALAGASSVGIQSTLGFNSLTTSSGQVLLVGELGQEKSEVIRTSTTTAPGGVSVTLNTTLRFDHSQDTKVYIIDWDRFEIRWASTVSGTKGTLMAYPEAIQPDQIKSVFNDTLQDSGYYFARFNNTINSTNSNESDAIPYRGYPDITIYEIKRRALESVHETIDGEIISNEFLNRALWQARREYHQMPGKRPFRRKFNTDIGNALTGSFFIELPDDLEKPYTAENVFGVRIGANKNMNFIDKKKWDFYYEGKPYSQLALPYTRNTSTSIWLLSGRDFSASASISVEGTTIGLSRITGEQNSFKIITHGSWNTSTGSDVFENISLGLPDEFTVFASVGGSARIYFNRPIETAYINQNIFCDYYRKVVDLDSSADELDEPNPDIYVPYLAAMIKKRKNPDLNLAQDDDYTLWLQKKNEAWQAEYAGTAIRLFPEIEHLL